MAEQKEQWREEFEKLQFKYKNNLDRSYNGYVDGDIHSQWIMYEAARKKAQEEISQLKEELKRERSAVDFYAPLS